MTAPNKILVAGYYGAQNAGDEAILSGLLASFRAAGYLGEFAVLSHDPADTRALHGVEAVAWNDIEAVIDASDSADLVVVGGGGLFQDYWGVDPATVLTSGHGGIAQYATPVYLAATLGKPCALLGVGVGPLRTAEGRDLTRAFQLDRVL
jgi:polysaccharide pyruvyl transferase WcaK-like protein